jgi:hypothetical protein
MLFDCIFTRLTAKKTLLERDAGLATNLRLVSQDKAVSGIGDSCYAFEDLNTDQSYSKHLFDDSLRLRG